MLSLAAFKLERISCQEFFLNKFTTKESIRNHFFFLAQQWRLTTEGKLENKLRTWAHGKKSSTQIPSYGEQGIINIAEKWGEKKILTFPARGNIMKYNVKLPEKFKSSQTWKIGHPDDRGWFKISSLKAENRYLTVTKIGRINQLTMEKEGMYSLKCLHLYYISFCQK